MRFERWNLFSFWFIFRMARLAYRNRCNYLSISDSLLFSVFLTSFFQLNHYVFYFSFAIGVVSLFRISHKQPVHIDGSSLCNEFSGWFGIVCLLYYVISHYQHVIDAIGFSQGLRSAWRIGFQFKPMWQQPQFMLRTTRLWNWVTGASSQLWHAEICKWRCLDSSATNRQLQYVLEEFQINHHCISWNEFQWVA